MAKESQLAEKTAACRDLAKRARRLAGTFLDGPDKDRLIQYAEDLDEQAAGLEAQEATRPPAQLAVTHEQQQVQQQVQLQPEPERGPSEPKPKA
jgi:hypothetical protein